MSTNLLFIFYGNSDEPIRMIVQQSIQYLSTLRYVTLLRDITLSGWVHYRNAINELHSVILPLFYCFIVTPSVMRVSTRLVHPSTVNTSLLYQFLFCVSPVAVDLAFHPYRDGYEPRLAVLQSDYISQSSYVAIVRVIRTVTSIHCLWFFV
jgi:hypothetical protein